MRFIVMNKVTTFCKRQPSFTMSQIFGEGTFDNDDDGDDDADDDDDDGDDDK